MFIAMALVFGLGSIFLPYYRSQQKTSVFQAGTAQAAGLQHGQTPFAANGSSSRSPNDLPVDSDGKINLNTADENVLEALPGIGPSRAHDIIEYRKQHNGFRAIEDLDNVPGFGPATMARLQAHITVGKTIAGFAPAARPPAPANTSSPPSAPVSPNSPAAAQASAQPQASSLSVADVNARSGFSAQAAAVGNISSSPQPSSSISTYPSAATTAFVPQPVQVRTPAHFSSPSATKPTYPVNINSANAEQLASLDRIGPALAQRIIQYRQQFGVFHSPEEIVNVKGIGPHALELNRNRITVH